MKAQLVKLLGFAGVGVFLASCSTPEHRPVVVTPGGEVVVSSPSSSDDEVTGEPPADSYQWIRGYWTYHDTRWVWIPGRWQHPLRTGTHWIPGHWDYTEQGWVWTPGHWDQLS